MKILYFILFHFLIYQCINNNLYSQTAESTKSDIEKMQVSPKIEPLPILSYDSNTGLGFGGKCVFLNQAGLKESFDITLYGSSKGERWARFVFSYPNNEIRQRKKYGIAVDFLIDYDLFQKYEFFGVGNSSRYQDKEYYAHNPIETSIILSSGITGDFVAQAGVKTMYSRNFNILLPPLGQLWNYSVELNKGMAYYYSLIINVRYDTRNSFINPSEGIVLKSDLQYAPYSRLWNVGFFKWGALFQYYKKIIFPDLIFAARLNYQQIIGNRIPIQFLLPMGGNSTLRGYPQDRYLDKLAALSNFELRFPLIWRFGGITGIDMGKVCNCPAFISLHNWPWNYVAGLRFYYDTYIVRFDAGFSKEFTGLYLTFDHLF